MKKPNLALRLMASAMSAKRKALAAKTERVAQIYSRQADRYLRAAARAEDARNALRIIKASNKQAAVTASRMRAEVDDLCVADEDDIIVNDIDDLDPIYSDDDFYGDEDVYAASDDDEDDEDEKDDDEDEKDDDKEVDSAMLRVLSRNRRLAAAKARGRRF